MRSLLPHIEKDLSKKFVFLTGPRQVGKTHLAQDILKNLGGKYYNWDLAEDRQQILEKSFLNDQRIVLDELHKYERWKSFLKGIYDKYHETLSILVTGSARLDIYQKGGDSLMGRHFLYHLHPLSIGELTHPTLISKCDRPTFDTNSAVESGLFETLFKLGGFPEPFYNGTEEAHNRWSLQRRELLVREEIRDLTNIQLLGLIEHLLLLLPKRVGSVLSINSLKEDLKVSYNTVAAWLTAFDKLYISFMLSPYSKNLSRTIYKEKKLYLWDWSQIKEESIRFENMVASHLLKAVHIWRDLGFGDYQLCFLRDRDRREVDFCITKDHKPWLLIEAKFSETQASETLIYFSNTLKVPGLQLVYTRDVHKISGPVHIMSAKDYLANLP